MPNKNGDRWVWVTEKNISWMRPREDLELTAWLLASLARTETNLSELDMARITEAISLA